MSKVEVSVRKILEIYGRTKVPAVLDDDSIQEAQECTIFVCERCKRCQDLRAHIKNPEIIEAIGEFAGDGADCSLIGLGLQSGALPSNPFPLPEDKVPAGKIESEDAVFQNTIGSQLG